MLQTEVLSLEQEKNNQLSPINFEELANVLGGKVDNKEDQKPTGSGGGFICWC